MGFQSYILKEVTAGFSSNANATEAAGMEAYM